MRPPFLRAAMLRPGEIIVDNFAGGGGASLGMEWALGRSPDIAINHDPQAVAMHTENHPDTEHFVEDVWDVDPVKACRGRQVGLAWFSPDCKHFSKAKGGKPVSKKIRGLAWIVVKWAKALKAIGKPIRVIMLENVEEFQTWGPLGEDDRPDALRKGLTFRRWKASLEKLGYVVEFRELIAADYGAPTTRKRLFLVARCDALPICWPTKTHDQHGRYGLPKWRAAAECIDWSLACPSIFLTPEEAKPLKVKRPLAENTMRRIARGLQKFVIDNPNPFIVGVGGRMGQSPERPVDRPMQTITAKGDSALAVPFVAKFRGDSPSTSAEDPLHTITAGPAEHPAGAAHAMALVSPTLHPVLPPVEEGNQVMPLIVRENQDLAGQVAPYLVRPAHGERDASGKKRGRGEHDAEAPLPTQTGSNEFAVVSAGIVPVTHQGGDRNVEEPLPTQTVENRFALVAAFMAQHNTGVVGHPMERPVSTIVGKGCTQNLVTSFGVKLKGTCRDGQQLDLPLHTVNAQGTHHARADAFLIKYYGTDQDPRLEEPMHTLTSKDRLGLVRIRGDLYQIVDIGMRMLVPPELYIAQGFPRTYKINVIYNGKPLPKDAQVRMVGNSVSPYPCAALVVAQFAAQEEQVAA